MKGGVYLRVEKMLFTALVELARNICSCMRTWVLPHVARGKLAIAGIFRFKFDSFPQSFCEPHVKKPPSEPTPLRRGGESCARLLNVCSYKD